MTHGGGTYGGAATGSISNSEIVVEEDAVLTQSSGTGFSSDEVAFAEGGSTLSASGGTVALSVSSGIANESNRIIASTATIEGAGGTSSENTFVTEESLSTNTSGRVLGKFGESGNESFTSNEENITNAAHSKSVSFRKNYQDPVLVSHIETQNGGQPIDTKATNVTSNSATIFSIEPDNEGHNNEEFGFVTMEAGHYTTQEGHNIEAQNVEIDTYVVAGESNPSGQTIEFDESFDVAPLIFANPKTHNSGDFSTTWINNVGQNSFELAQLVDTNNSQSAETISWIAVDPGIEGELGQALIETTRESSTATSYNLYDNSPDAIVDWNSAGDFGFIRGSGISKSSHNFSLERRSGGSDDYATIAIKRDSGISFVEETTDVTESVIYTSANANPRTAGSAGAVVDSPTISSSVSASQPSVTLSETLDEASNLSVESTVLPAESVTSSVDNSTTSKSSASVESSSIDSFATDGATDSQTIASAQQSTQTASASSVSNVSAAISTQSISTQKSSATTAQAISTSTSSTEISDEISSVGDSSTLSASGGATEISSDTASTEEGASISASATTIEGLAGETEETTFVTIEDAITTGSATTVVTDSIGIATSDATESPTISTTIFSIDEQTGASPPTELVESTVTITQSAELSSITDTVETTVSTGLLDTAVENTTKLDSPNTLTEASGVVNQSTEQGFAFAIGEHSTPTTTIRQIDDTAIASQNESIQINSAISTIASSDSSSSNDISIITTSVANPSDLPIDTEGIAIDNAEIANSTVTAINSTNITSGTDIATKHNTSDGAALLSKSNGIAADLSETTIANASSNESNELGEIEESSIITALSTLTDVAFSSGLVTDSAQTSISTSIVADSISSALAETNAATSTTATLFIETEESTNALESSSFSTSHLSSTNSIEITEVEEFATISTTTSLAEGSIDIGEAVADGIVTDGNASTNAASENTSALENAINAIAVADIDRTSNTSIVGDNSSISSTVSSTEIGTETSSTNESATIISSLSTVGPISGESTETASTIDESVYTDSVGSVIAPIEIASAEPVGSIIETATSSSDSTNLTAAFDESVNVNSLSDSSISSEKTSSITIAELATADSILAGSDEITSALDSSNTANSLSTVEISFEETSVIDSAQIANSVGSDLTSNEITSAINQAISTLSIGSTTVPNESIRQFANISDSNTETATVDSIGSAVDESIVINGNANVENSENITSAKDLSTIIQSDAIVLSSILARPEYSFGRRSTGDYSTTETNDNDNDAITE